jgi:hypothetical protein
MTSLIRIVANTPLWVWPLFAYLVWRGIQAMKPGDTTLIKLAIMPAVFLVWGLYGLWRFYGFGFEGFGPWIVALLLGAVGGWLILRRQKLEIDRARGVVHHPADDTVLPLNLLAFGFKYAFGVMAVVSPQLLREVGFRLLDLGTSGLFAGIFLGKFANVTARRLESGQ